MVIEYRYGISCHSAFLMASSSRVMLAISAATLQRRKLNLKATFESGSSRISFKAFNFRRFQRGFDRVNLHRPTSRAAASTMGSSPSERSGAG